MRDGEESVGMDAAATPRTKPTGPEMVMIRSGPV